MEKQKAKIVESCITLCRVCKDDKEKTGLLCRPIGRYSKRWCDECGKHVVCNNYDVVEGVRRTW